LTIDVDATLITAHSEKEKAAGNYKHGYGFHPLHAYADETREALGAMLRPGNAGSNTAADHKTVIDRALAQIPVELIESIEILIRADSAGATHAFADHCHDANLRFSFGYELTETVRAAILETPDENWIPALDQDGSERENGEVIELTDRLDLSTWPEGSRLIVRRERPHPGAQLSFTDHDGYRVQAILTDQTDTEIAILDRRHRQRARVEDRIRDDKDTGLAKFPFKAFALNEVWLEIVLLAHELLVWTQALVLEGELSKAEPKRLRYRLLHVGARLAFSGRRGKLHLPGAWPWTEALKVASRISRRFPPPSANHQPPRDTPQQTPGHTPRSPLPRTPPNHLGVPAETPCRPRSQADMPLPPTQSDRKWPRESPSDAYCTIGASAAFARSHRTGGDDRSGLRPRRCSSRGWPFGRSRLRPPQGLWRSVWLRVAPRREGCPGPVLTPTHRVHPEQPLRRPLRVRADALGLVPMVLERRLQFATAFRVTAAGDVPIYQRGGCLRRRFTLGQQIEEQKLNGLGVRIRCVEHRTSPGRPPLYGVTQDRFLGRGGCDGRASRR
jgi:hypothetical protein